jgi:hypothetical protein
MDLYTKRRVNRTPFPEDARCFENLEIPP